MRVPEVLCLIIVNGGYHNNYSGIMGDIFVIYLLQRILRPFETLKHTMLVMQTII